MLDYRSVKYYEIDLTFMTEKKMCVCVFSYYAI